MDIIKKNVLFIEGWTRIIFEALVEVLVLKEYFIYYNSPLIKVGLDKYTQK